VHGAPDEVDVPDRGGEVEDAGGVGEIAVAPVAARDPEVGALLAALTAELAGSGYTPEETFGYSVEQLERSGVRLAGARVGPRLVGIGGIEPQGGGDAELKRFYVVPDLRGRGVADALMAALLSVARDAAVRRVRLETGDRQIAAVRMYRRHGFAEIPRFGPYVDSEASVCMELTLGGSAAD
jgi:putative acetyltransferase